MFLVRRLLYAIVIVWADEVMHVGVLLVLFSSMVMMAYACKEWQWKDSIINYQHILNESAIYLVCAYIFCSSTLIVDAEVRWQWGFVLIAVCFIYVLYNAVVMIIYAIRLI